MIRHIPSGRHSRESWPGESGGETRRNMMTWHVRESVMQFRGWRPLLIALTLACCWRAHADADSKESRTAKSSLSLTVTGEVNEAMAPIAGKMTTLFFESYPRLLERFEHPEKPAPRAIRLHFNRNLKIPAQCSGNVVEVGVEWLKRHPDDLGMLTHELTHAVQQYPRSDPSWLTEGIADYARQLYGPAEQPNWSLPARLGPKNHYRDSYRVTARFLLWLDGKHPGTVDKLHRRMQDRAFTVADFKEFTGTELDELWQQCLAAQPST